MKILLTFVFVAAIATLGVMNGNVQGEEHPKSEHPKGEHPKGEHPKADASKEESPKSESKKEEPRKKPFKSGSSRSEHPKRHPK